MLSDKELGLRLLDWIQQLYVRNAALEATLDILTHDQDWRSYVKKLETNPDHHATMHAKLEPFRQLMLDAPDLTAIVRQMLEEAERIDPEEND